MPNKRVLIVLKSYLGDAVMATPLVRALSPLELSIRAPGVVHELLSSPHLPYRPLSSISFRGLAELLAEAKKLRGSKFEAAILVNRSFRSALLAKLARIPMRIGHSTEGRSWLLTDTIPYDMAAPETKSYAELARPIGIDVDCLRPVIWVSEEEKIVGKETLRGAEIGLQPGARYLKKAIPYGALKMVVDQAAASGHGLALLGGSDEVEAASALGGQGLNLAGLLSLRQSMGVAANLKALVGGDTGFMHVAAAVGCPTVTAFGPTPSEKWGHRYPPHQIVQAWQGDMGSLSGEELWKAVDRILRR